MKNAVVIRRGLSGLEWFVTPEWLVDDIKRHSRDDGMPVTAVVRVKEEPYEIPEYD